MTELIPKKNGLPKMQKENQEKNNKSMQNMLLIKMPNVPKLSLSEHTCSTEEANSARSSSSNSDPPSDRPSLESPRIQKNPVFIPKLNVANLNNPIQNTKPTTPIIPKIGLKKQSTPVEDKRKIVKVDFLLDNLCTFRIQPNEEAELHRILLEHVNKIGQPGSDDLKETDVDFFRLKPLKSNDDIIHIACKPKQAGFYHFFPKKKIYMFQ